MCTQLHLNAEKYNLKHSKVSKLPGADSSTCTGWAENVDGRGGTENVLGGAGISNSGCGSWQICDGGAGGCTERKGVGVSFLKGGTALGIDWVTRGE